MRLQPNTNLDMCVVQLLRQRLCYGSVMADLEGTRLSLGTGCEKMRHLNL